jgi:uncharacterized protein (TIGR02117 family)
MRASWASTLLLVVAVGSATSMVPAAAPDADTRIVTLIGHGWHVGIAMRRADISEALWPESAALGPVRYLEVGWGDADYYPAARGHPGLAFRAAFASSGSVLHVVGVDAPLADFFAGAEIVEVPVSVHGFEALTRFIHDAYARDAAGAPIVVAPGRYAVSRFYRAEGRYRLLDNSNSWAAKALAAAGCPIDPGETPTAGRLLDIARRLGIACIVGP